MLLLTLTILLFTSCAFAQKQILYYSSNWEITPRELATYFRVCNYNATYLYFKGEVKDYTLDSTLIMSGSYSDYGIKEGEFSFYFPSGKLQAQGSFKKGLRDGAWKYLFENGNLQREVVFSDSTFSPINEYDIHGKKIIVNGTGPWRFEYERYNEKETCIIKGKFKNGKKEGAWTCLLSTGDMVYRENYSKGQFKSGTVFLPYRHAMIEPFDNQFALPYKFQVTEKFLATDETRREQYPLLRFLPVQNVNINDGTNLDDEKVYMAVEQQAEFPGGMSAFTEFLTKNVNYPADARQQKIQGKVFLKFIVEKDGAISEIEIVKGVYPSLDQEALRLVSTFPRWIPGRQAGKPVRSLFVLPVYFKLER